MPPYASRKPLPRFEIPGGMVHVTWRLHSGQGSLTDEERSLVLNVILRATEFGAHLEAGVVMDDHIHVLFVPGDLRTSVEFVASWKGVSTILILRASGREAPVWQRSFFQRWMRSPAHTKTCAAYIHANPRRRWPGIIDYPWILP